MIFTSVSHTPGGGEFVTKLEFRPIRILMIALDTALQGMQRAETSFKAAAGHIAQASAAPPEDSASLSQSSVALLQSKNDFGANVKAAQTADDIAKTTLDMLA